MYLIKNVNFQKCSERDIVRTGQFYDDVILWLNDHENYPRWIYKVYPSENSVRSMVKAGGQYIYRDGETILAAFALNTQPQGNFQRGSWSQTLADGSYMVLHALAIDPQSQRRGIGTEIVRFCIDKAKSGNYKAIRVDIVPTNYPARRFFEKNGFVYAGDVDLELNIGDIPEFSLYELNI